MKKMIKTSFKNISIPTAASFPSLIKVQPLTGQISQQRRKIYIFTTQNGYMASIENPYHYNKRNYIHTSKTKLIKWLKDVLNESRVS